MSSQEHIQQPNRDQRPTHEQEKSATIARVNLEKCVLNIVGLDFNSYSGEHKDSTTCMIKLYEAEHNLGIGDDPSVESSKDLDEGEA